MTTLAAIQGDGWCVIGCDSRSSDDSGRPMNLATTKIISNNGYLIAGSGASRGSNLLQFGWKPPKPTAGENLDAFMTTTFIPAMRELFVEAGYDMKGDGDAAEHDSEFIIAINGVLYPIFEDYSWDRDRNGIYYSGSGGPVALGALAEILDRTPATTPKQAGEAIRRAITRAARWDVYTAEPIHIKVQLAKAK